MASRLVTPPLASDIKTPGAPKHGAFDDDYKPYGPRKSGRLANQSSQRYAQTPSPEPAGYNLRGSNKSSPASQKKKADSSSSSPLTVAKKRVPTTSLVGDSRRVSGALTEESTAEAAEALGLSPKKDAGQKSSHHPSTAYRSGTMLPTPIKTPQKSPKKASPAMNKVARKLMFPERHASVDDAMPSAKRGHNLGLNGYHGRDDAPVEVYVDWSARVPEVDLSPDNPFYGPGAASHDPFNDPVKKPVGKVTVRGEGEISAEEAYGRKDGLVFVFRGKKIFRKFSDLEKDRQEEDARDMAGLQMSDELDATVPARLRGPMTRSSLKPVLLFPNPEQIAVRQKKAQVTDDEEVMTDLEDPTAVVSTSAKHLNDFAITPKAAKVAKVALVSPPTTARATRNYKMDVDSSGPSSNPTTPSARATRSSKMDIDISGPSSGPATHPARTTRSSKMDIDSSARPVNPVTPPPSRLRAGRASPFESWKRTKTISPVQTRKREGDLITRSGGDLTKRRRGGRGPST